MKFDLSRVLGNREWNLTALFALLTGLLTTLTLVFHFQLWKMHPTVPFDYQGDGVFHVSVFQNLKDNGKIWTNPNLGFPGGQQFFDFPVMIADTSILTIAWIIMKFGATAALVYNLLYLGGYVVASVSGFIGARLLGVSNLSSSLVGFLFTFLPYHFQHGAGHLFLSWYAPIPIWVAIILRQVSDRPIFSDSPPIRNVGLRKFLSYRPHLIAAVLGLFIGSSGLYYATFMLLLIVFAISYHLTLRKSPYQVMLLMFLACSTAITLVLQALPALIFRFQNGKNLVAGNRTANELEFYSLRTIDLFLPIVQHRIQTFSEFAIRNASIYIPGEPTEALGIVGSLGIAIIVVSYFVYLNKSEQQGKTTKMLFPFLMFLILSSSTGNGPQLLGALGITGVRVWSRMSVVLGFIALVAVGQFFDYVLFRPKVSRFFFALTLLFVGYLGFLDTNPSFDSRIFDNNAQIWNNEAKLVADVEASIGPHSAIFQLPVIPFPENPPVVTLSDYHQSRGFLHSKTLCWSYGSTKGREGQWLESLEDLSPEMLISEVKSRGFNSIWIERGGYEDNGDEVISALTRLVGSPVVTDSLNRVVVFKISSSILSDCQEKSERKQ